MTILLCYCQVMAKKKWCVVSANCAVVNAVAGDDVVELACLVEGEFEF